MYAFFIPTTLDKKERMMITSSIAKVAQGFRLEAQIFHDAPLSESINKAYAMHATVFIPFGDGQWFDTVLTQSIKQLRANEKLPTFSQLTRPPTIPVLKDQYLLYQLRQRMSILAARRLKKRFLYRAGDQYFLDTIRIRQSDNVAANIKLDVELVNQSSLQCEFEASELLFQAYHHADHDEVGLLYLTAQRPTLRGSEKIQTKQSLAVFPSQISIGQTEPILRLPLKNAMIYSPSKLVCHEQLLPLPLRIGPLAEKITVIEAKNTVQ